MKIIIVGANDYQKVLFEPLKNVIDAEVIFVDSIVKIEPITIKEQIAYTLMTTPISSKEVGKLYGLKADTFIIGDKIDFNQGKRLSSLDDVIFIKAMDNLNRSVANKSKPKLITYGPKQSCGKGKTKRWK